MFRSDHDRQAIHDATDAGVSAYVVERVDQARVQPIIGVAIAQFRRFQALREQLDKTRRSLSEPKLVGRAKGLLMSRRGLTEPEARRSLRKLAMDRNRRLAGRSRAAASNCSATNSGTHSST